MFSQQDKAFMSEAFELAQESYNYNEVPVGAIIVNNGKIIGRGRNNVITNNDVTSHAEINAIKDASKNIQNYRLVNCQMYVTLEPCHMCAKAIVDSRLKSVIFSTLEPKSGCIISIDNFLDARHVNHRVEYQYGLMQKESSDLLKSFFEKRR